MKRKYNQQISRSVLDLAAGIIYFAWKGLKPIRLITRRFVLVLSNDGIVEQMTPQNINITLTSECILVLASRGREVLGRLPVWWRNQMELFSALLVICAGNSPVTGEFPAQRHVTRSFNVFFDVRLIIHLRQFVYIQWDHR